MKCHIGVSRSRSSRDTEGGTPSHLLRVCTFSFRGPDSRGRSKITLLPHLKGRRRPPPSLRLPPVSLSVFFSPLLTPPSPFSIHSLLPLSFLLTLYPAALRFLFSASLSLLSFSSSGGPVKEKKSVPTDFEGKGDPQRPLVPCHS